ncbi:hypothetical protein JTE90_018606 [Oedothorax gibbosus]|uniref:Uncharacterized protein n=1 Tax=Oedothorax gibbosus TaxID=931172 RepID=A0AAV6TJE9_9ARAC|nr:hypothetical protein JTE90_018606 [Oedothorax gibbosus]
MPRKKRSCDAATSKSSKRWCKENTVHVVSDPSSQPQPQTNERLSGLNFHPPENILETSTKYILVEVGHLSQLFAGLK